MGWRTGVGKWLLSRRFGVRFAAAGYDPVVAALLCDLVDLWSRGRLHCRLGNSWRRRRRGRGSRGRLALTLWLLAPHSVTIALDHFLQ